MTHKIKNSTLASLGLGVVLAMVILFLSQLFFPYALSSSFFALNKEFQDPNIVVVALDDVTLNSNSFKRYQDINRCDYATLLKNIMNAEPTAVGVDVFFSASSKEVWCDEELTALLQKNPKVFIWTEYNEEAGEIIPVFNGKEKIDNLGLVNTHGYHLAAAFAEAFFGLAHTTDTRNSVLLYTLWKDVSILPLPVALYKVSRDMASVDISQSEISFGKNSFPHEDGRMFINFFTAEYPTVSFIDVISNRFDPELFRGKTVFVGATSHDIHDEFYTPFDTRNFMPGVMIHANAYNTLTAEKPITLLPFWMQILVGLIFTGVLAAIIFVCRNTVHGILLWVAYLLISIAVAAGIFYYFGIFIEVFPLVTVSVFVAWAVYVWKFIEERHSKDEIRSMFSKYVSSDVAKELIENGIEKLELGWKEQQVTVFFSDIAGFTDLSENLSPSDLGRVMNAYFEEMSNIILSKRGTIDKFIGDAVMAFWNAPIEQKNHAELACESAILQRQSLEKVRDIIRAIDATIFVDMRIGIHTGKAVIGNFGCSNRFNYTAFWDTVNLASRLEGINKQYGTNIIISESTYSALTPWKFLAREIDMIVVKGKTEPIRIYELVGFQGAREEVQEQQKIADYATALSLYRGKNFKEAAKVFAKIGDIPSTIFVERCELLEKQWVSKDWDGIYRFETK